MSRSVCRRSWVATTQSSSLPGGCRHVVAPSVRAMVDKNLTDGVLSEVYRDKTITVYAARSPLHTVTAARIAAQPPVDATAACKSLGNKGKKILGSRRELCEGHQLCRRGLRNPRLTGGHIDESAVMALEGNDNRARRAVAVLRHNEVSLARSR